MINKKLYLSAPLFLKNTLHHIKKILFNDDYISCYKKYNKLFENRIIKMTKSLYCKTVSSGSAGLHIALRALNVKLKDKVFCPSFSFIATATPILYLGAVPIFIDSEINTWNICPCALEKAIIFYKKKKNPPKILIITHVYGMPAKMDLIMQICKYYDIKIIEDAAAALGSLINNQYAGTIGNIGVYSFNMNKIITSCAGGAVVTNELKLYKKIKLLSMHYRLKTKNIDFCYKTLGYNYTMNSISAAIGYSQIQNIVNRIKKKRKIYNLYYKKMLTLTNKVIFQEEISKNIFSNRWLTCIYTKYEKRSFVLLKPIFKDQNIEFRSLWYPLHLQPVFNKSKFFKITSNAISCTLFRGGLCLLSSYNLKYIEQNKVINIVTNYINNR